MMTLDIGLLLCATLCISDSLFFRLDQHLYADQ